MPAPLIWLGAGLAAIYAGSQYARHEQKRAGHVGVFPGDCDIPVRPENGAIVCCGIYELFQHTGIWVEDSIVELKGNGLVRAVSPHRFIEDRSGNQVYVACDAQLNVLHDELSAQRAARQVYQYLDYDVIDQNCHRFVWETLSGRDARITRFAELNACLCDYFSTPVHWQPLMNNASNL
ncbi:hypothetical protein [Aestuariibacter salexigens]|uniref:hypothetical protein n=1 Tax=Aestuariibacter salexigens TaxID=226010 RepID=UPI000402A099|nr:hypothetical protein [Aestuariibacter salexigens]